MREIEILVELHSDIEDAKQKVNHLDFKGVKTTIDTYYYDPLRSNLILNDDNKLLECCRLRTKNQKHFLTYKVDIYEGTIWKYSDESETEISDIEAFKKVMFHLGLQVLVVVENNKYTYETDKFELVLEKVTDLGNFLEVEYKTDDETKTVDQIKNEVKQFILSLGLSIGEELNSGKPELLILRQKTLRTT
jgi:predicted adenylyl cyclase CyaB